MGHPCNAGVAYLNAYSDPPPAVVTNPIQSTKDTLQAATGVATAVYETSLVAAQDVGSTLGGAATAAATAPLRGGEAVVHGTVDAVTAAVKVPAQTATAAVRSVVNLGTTTVTAPIGTAGAVISAVVDAAAAAAAAPVHATAAQELVGGVLSLPVRAVRTSGRAVSGLAGVLLAIIGLAAGELENRYVIMMSIVMDTFYLVSAISYISARSELIPMHPSVLLCREHYVGDGFKARVIVIHNGVCLCAFVVMLNSFLRLALAV